MISLPQRMSEGEKSYLDEEFPVIRIFFIYMYSIYYNLTFVCIQYNDFERISVDVIAVPRGDPRNLLVYDPTTSTLSVSWEHAEGPVLQYRIGYAPTTGDPIEEFVSGVVFYSSEYEGQRHYMLTLGI